MKIAIVGPGAMGLMLAARLKQAGAEVSLLDHRAQRARLIDEQGVFLEHSQGEDHLTIPAGADPAMLAKVDLAVICTKAYHTQEVARALRDHLSDNARALTLQNGAENVEILVDALGPERVLGGITSEGATLLAPGRVRHAGRGVTHVGPARGLLDDFTCQVRDMLIKAGFETEASEGVQNLIWTKVVINVGINPLTAILDVLNGRLLELAPARELMAAAVEEAVAVGKALGIRFLHQDMLAAVQQVARRTGTNISSMRQDVLSKRRTEVAYINGAVVRQGEQVGLPTPINQTLTQLVQAKEAEYLGEAKKA
ncbi:MAG: 2-dehydropantoate 2-reductase [Desulfarculaceae bacterium]|nr:2-dehydropantoate 2-reductase [Desulfarculaceae bacterium]MCF8045980.1 2-dehydropantoate 2-reductase [Desulfarculaceae bacterium]MCF8065713.1 2-dehydropantoate 2-reductase [Desulfarculaceae bacterium]MCF8097470.1 2-dehydropantoate 2-reductase [Desulfarculaceae bacterium]MCF8122458.1 2-dehydropantoate 2-reductase [Desulfarculaceae bacterium]